MDLTSIQLLVLDVDGVMTDGRVSSTADGTWAKAFYVQDGCALKLWQATGATAALLSGRSDEGVAQRAAELGIDCVRFGVNNKLAAFEDLLASTAQTNAATAYIGDDLPDLGPMERCGFPVAVANAAPAVKRLAAYVTRRRGGDGAVAEVVELILRKRGRWSRSLLGQA